jgi:hypothetical protein
MFFEKRTIREHGNRVRMKSHSASVTTLDFGGIHHMIEVAVSQQKQIHPHAGKGGVRSLRRVEKNVSDWSFIEKAIGFEGTAGKGFEPIHGKVVSENK